MMDSTGLDLGDFMGFQAPLKASAGNLMPIRRLQRSKFGGQMLQCGRFSDARSLPPLDWI